MKTHQVFFDLYILLFVVGIGYGQEQNKLTVAGRTVEQLIESYNKNWSLSDSQFSMTFPNDENERKLNVFLLEPFELPKGKIAFLGCKFIRFFCSRDILHGISVFTGVNKDLVMTYLMNDEQVEDFLQQAEGAVQNEEDFKALITSFTLLRSYDILTEKPVNLNEWKAPLKYEHDYPSSEWGLHCDYSKDGPKGYVTVVGGIYSPIVRRYDFELTKDRKLKITGKRDLFIGTRIR